MTTLGSTTFAVKPQRFRMVYVNELGKVRGVTFTAAGPYSAHELAQRWATHFGWTLQTVNFDDVRRIQRAEQKR